MNANVPILRYAPIIITITIHHQFFEEKEEIIISGLPFTLPKFLFLVQNFDEFEHETP